MKSFASFAIMFALLLTACSTEITTVPPPPVIDPGVDPIGGGHGGHHAYGNHPSSRA